MDKWIAQWRKTNTFAVIPLNEMKESRMTFINSVIASRVGHLMKKKTKKKTGVFHHAEQNFGVGFLLFTLLVYNLRGGFLGSVTPAPEQKDFRTQSTSIWVFWDYTKMF